MKHEMGGCYQLVGGFLTEAIKPDIRAICGGGKAIRVAQGFPLDKRIYPA